MRRISVLSRRPCQPSLPVVDNNLSISPGVRCSRLRTSAFSGFWGGVSFGNFPENDGWRSSTTLLTGRIPPGGQCCTFPKRVILGKAWRCQVGEAHLRSAGAHRTWRAKSNWLQCWIRVPTCRGGGRQRIIIYLETHYNSIVSQCNAGILAGRLRGPDTCQSGIRSGPFERGNCRALGPGRGLAPAVAYRNWRNTGADRPLGTRTSISQLGSHHRGGAGYRLSLRARRGALLIN